MDTRLSDGSCGVVQSLRIRPGQSKGEGAGASSKEVKAGKNKEAKTTGEIVNLMAVDAQRLQDLMSYFATLVREYRIKIATNH